MEREKFQTWKNSKKWFIIVWHENSIWVEKTNLDLKPCNFQVGWQKSSIKHKLACRSITTFEVYETWKCCVLSCKNLIQFWWKNLSCTYIYVKPVDKHNHQFIVQLCAYPKSNNATTWLLSCYLSTLLRKRRHWCFVNIQKRI